MLTRRRRWVLLVTVVALAIAAVGLVALRGCRAPVCDSVAYPAGGVRISTGGKGGVYEAYGLALRDVLEDDLPGLQVEVENSGGSVDNLSRMANGRVDLAFISADTAFRVPALEQQAGAPGRIRAIARVYDEYVQLVVRSDSSIRSLSDLRGKRVSVGSEGSSVEITAKRLLAAANMNDETDIQRRGYGVSQSADLLADGDLDAFFWVGGLPTTAVAELASTVPIRLLPLDRYVDTLHRQYGSFYQSATVPQGTYTNVPDTRTAAVPSYLLASTTLSADLVFRLTEALFTHRTRIAEVVPSSRVLDVRTAISTASIPLHPGAERYYRSIKP
ncbi:TAXI family TRAP transporter solute-binding subunit [Cryptosporangium phraense]|uniref:TAXI family TRAP transporter solute-binding subunit n=1 Tax=Cryptosporangium phraense TaxID=2593070 RepID=UPI0014793879|nr:TAXI family TRAP transporter solute-binding subunit [Cryptosporangium phraense]